MKTILLGFALTMTIGLSAQAAKYKGTGDIGSMSLNSGSYHLKNMLQSFTHSNGRGWSKVVGDWKSFQLILEPKVVSRDQKCRTQAPKLILNFKEIGESEMSITVDPSTVFYGQTLTSLFKKNAPHLEADDTNTWGFEAVAMKNMALLGVTIRLNTNPKDEEDVGKIDLSITDTSVSLSVYDGDDDGGDWFEIRGVNDGTLYDNKMPVLDVSCSK